MSINCTPRLIDMDVVGVTCMLFTVFVAWFSRIVSGALSPEDGLALLSSERCMAALSEGFRKIMAAQNEFIMAFKSYHEDKLDLLMSSDKPKGSTPAATKGVSSTQSKGGQPVTPSPSKKETHIVDRLSLLGSSGGPNVTVNRARTRDAMSVLNPSSHSVNLRKSLTG
jgi:hypothetical protein